MGTHRAHWDAAILDVDGVLTHTAAQHERAWKEMFDAELARRGDLQPFTHEEYLLHVDGRPRLDGARAIFEARGVPIPDDELRAAAEAKNAIFQRFVASEGVQTFRDSVQTVREWKRRGLGIAFVSASRNARKILEAAGLAELADVCIDGETAAAEGLHGKLEMFREAARRLDAEPARAVVVEDAVSGVEAASEGGFGMVIGLARTGDDELLASHGATRVVPRLDALVDVVAEPDTRPATDLSWALDEQEVACLARRNPIVFLDFDGTLAPIVDQPDAAALPEEAREAVRALAARCPVVVMSGRDRPDVTCRVGVGGLWYVGSHGFDVAGPDGAVWELPAAGSVLPALHAAAARAEAELGGVPGLVFERKRFALAVHYRNATDAAATRAVSKVVEIAEATPGLRTHVDLKVIELRPDLEWDKGYAVMHVMALLFSGGAPVYVGDGRTDEDAFRAVGQVPGGVAVRVGASPRPTSAHLRLHDPEEVTRFLQALTAALDAPLDPSWALRWGTWDPAQEPLREALCTLGNGCFATRGAAEEGHADGVHYPGTYLAGGYNRLVTEISGELLENEDLVNWPNWLPLTFRPVDPTRAEDGPGEWFSLGGVEILDYAQALDLRTGVLRRTLRVRDAEGRTSRLRSERFVSMHDPHVAALRWELVAEDWSGPVEVRSSLDGTVTNEGVARYCALRGDHLVPDGTGSFGEDTMWLDVHTRQSQIRMAQVARTRVTSAHENTRRQAHHVDRVDQVLVAEVVAERPLVVEKVVAISTSRDLAIADPLENARVRMGDLPVYEALRARHVDAWARLHRRLDIRLDGGAGEDANQALRLHVFHLLQVASPHIVDRDVGIPARGLHGEAYRGHVFWDELFVFPFLNYRFPELARELMLYRYRRLGSARRIARTLGHAGACFPWQSGSDGREETQLLHLNPRSGRWLRDDTDLQRHVGAAVAWNVWQYFEVTGDLSFLSTYGAEMLVEIARFWSSVAEWDADLERFRIRGVMGPDEFHTGLPGAERRGLDDNAYTNVMAAWCLGCAERALDTLGPTHREELLDRLQVPDGELARWREVRQKLRVVFEGHVISAFDGYAALEEFDWKTYRARYGNIQRLDRILEAEGDTVNRYKASKQADVLMLFFLFGDDELVELLGSMGYPFERAWVVENVDYYLRRTSHGSTLSHVLHSWVLARHDRPRSWRLFLEALRADVADVQGGTTAEGIHLGAMAGSVDLVQRAYTGAVLRDGVLCLEPRLPDELEELSLGFQVRGARLDVRVTREAVEVAFSSALGTTTASVAVNGQVHQLSLGEHRSFALESRAAPETQ